MGDSGFKDRRVFSRVAINLPLYYISSNLNKERRANTYDISASGIGLLAYEKLPLHASLDIQLNIPDDGELLRTKGEVVWVKKVKFNKYMVGVSLESVDLMGMSQVLALSRSLKDTYSTNPLKVISSFLRRCSSLLRKPH